MEEMSLNPDFYKDNPVLNRYKVIFHTKTSYAVIYINDYTSDEVRIIELAIKLCFHEDRQGIVQLITGDYMLYHNIERIEVKKTQ
jgi:hypothetical protein